MQLIMKIKNFFSQEFFKNILIHWVLIISIFINGACWGALLFFVRPVDFPIILHYNVYFGVDMIGAWWQAYLLPWVAVIIMMINVILAYFFHNYNQRIIAYILLLAAFLVQVGSAVAIGGIIRINY